MFKKKLGGFGPCDLKKPKKTEKLIVGNYLMIFFFYSTNVSDNFYQ